MKKFYIAIALAIAAATVVTGMLMMREEPQWTTSSEAALAEFRLGREDEMRLYRADAHQHYARAVELDPDFVMAKLRHSYTGPMPDPAKLLEEVNAIRTEKLTDREKFIVSLLRSDLKRDENRAARSEKLILDYLAKKPKDPVVLAMRCDRLWQRKVWSEAEICYKKLLEVDPNYVIAQNNLGYLRMAQGRFAESEEAFTMYRYIAPDQANPHDSLGELLSLRGRYDEAERELEQALAVRPDFCASYEHLVAVHLLTGNIARARDVVTRASGQTACGPAVAGLGCQIDSWELMDRGELIAAGKRANEPECLSYGVEPFLFAHAAALQEGRVDDAIAIEKSVAPAKPPLKERRENDPTLEMHLRGMRLAHQKDYVAAVSAMSLVDQELDYWGNGRGFYKLYNRVALANTLSASGQAERAAAIMREIENVNPTYARRVARFFE